MKKNNKTTKKHQSLGAVHTHTHTHTGVLLQTKK